MRKFIRDIIIGTGIVLILVTLAGCAAPAAPAAPAAAGGAAAAPSGDGKPKVTLLLPTWANTQNIQEQIKTYNNDPKSLATLEVNFLPNDVYASKLKAMQAADKFEVDAALLVNNGDIQTFQASLAPWDGDVFDDFLPGARKSVSANGALSGTPLGVPWQRFLCTTTYYHLVVFKQSQYEKETKDALQFLTAPQQQNANLKEDIRYPTRKSINSDSPNCGDGSSSMATASFDRDIASQIAQSSDLNSLKDELESKLKEAKVLPDGAMILLKERLAYYIEGAEGNYITKPGEYTVLVAAPIARADGSPVQLPQELSATPGQAVAMVNAGKLVIDEAKKATYTPDKSRVDAVVLTSGVSQLQKASEMKAYLFSLDQKSKEAQYSIEDVFGANPPTDRKGVEIMEFVEFAYGSPGVMCRYGSVWTPFGRVPYCICVNY